MSLPLDELKRRARVKIRLVSDREALLDDISRTMADEIKRRNAQDLPTRFILPVGPVAQYPKLVAICNRERISWRNVYTFNMDEFLDWQGRPIPVVHPLSFEGFMRRTLFTALDPELRMPADH
ncbi:MAG TPA: hypothetical protein VFW30_04250, partial [Bryocella sp.]|nr:hypothetical protein [Bryocella sp.]